MSAVFIPKSTGHDPLVIALIVLTFTTGLIDAASYIGLGRVFVANMTGNVVLLGFAVAGIPGLSVTRSLLSLLGFLLGAALGGRLQTVLAGENRRKWLLSVGVLETAHCNTLYKKCCTWFVNLGNPDFLEFSGFRVALAIASLPGMTGNLCQRTYGTAH